MANRTRTDEERADTITGTVEIPPVTDRFHLYFIRDPVGGFVKIGISRQVANRFIDLQSMIPQDIEIAGICPGDHKLEKTLHREFSRSIKRGEWFHITDEINARMRELCGNLKPCRPSFRAYERGPLLRESLLVNVPLPR